MKTVVRVVGARPQYMQVPLLKKQIEDAGARHILIHTGQHYDPLLADSIMAELGLEAPAINLRVGSASHAEMTAQIMVKLEGALKETRPDFVVVDGDTNSTLATALTVMKMRIPLLHIEAGIRDFDRDRPEELNRIMTDHAADLNAAPIPRALDNLKREDLGKRSFLTGDLLLDNFLAYRGRADHAFIDKLGFGDKNFNFLTLHRPENTDPSRMDKFSAILDFVESRGKPVLFAVHPRTEKLVQEYRKSRPGLKNLRFFSSLLYLQSLAALERADTVFTDSGGLSREAVWSGTKTLMFFHYDTWHDLLERGWAQIAKEGLVSMEQAYARLRSPSAEEACSLFGSGRGAERVMELLRTNGWL